MFPNFAERVAYGRKIQSEAENLMASYGVYASQAAFDRANAPGLTLDDEAFRRAVEERVARMTGDRVPNRAA